MSKCQKVKESSLVQMKSIRFTNNKGHRLDVEVYENTDDVVIRLFIDDVTSRFVLDSGVAQRVIDFIADGYGSENKDDDNGQKQKNG